MTGFLSLIIFAPVLGAAVIGLWPRLSVRGIRLTALTACLVSLGLSLVLFIQFDRSGGVQFEEFLNWIPSLNVHYHLGVDGLSLPLVLLTTILSFVAVLISYQINTRIKAYFIWFLFLESSILGVFCSLDLLLFFIFWEIEVIPMYFLISIWGSGRKDYSATKYVLYTLFGSALMLAGMVCVYFATGSFDIMALSAGGQLLIQTVLPAAPLFLLLLIGFAVKLPVVPFHTWLPDAHTDAPTAVSVMLAGSLIKMGGYGMIRVCVGLFPTVARDFAPALIALAVISIVYGGAIVLRQTDLKRLIAYSSVSHMGFVLLGIFALSQTSLTGATLQMVSHGLITGLLFAAAGLVMHNTHERAIDRLGGLARQMPRAAVIFIIGGLGALGLPGTSGFVAEFTTFLGAFSSTEVAGIKIAVLIALLGILLAAAYMLWLIQRVFFGPSTVRFDGIRDASRLEVFYCGILILTIFAVGLCPAILTGAVQNVFNNILRLLT
ncbi:MAG: NADH-quinone oxidoreductase subunit M [Dehalococcoidia bacterium]|nr:NADH-quinone oxidoreductase subunit M [Dehalococcoidia bacterium]